MRRFSLSFKAAASFSPELAEVVLNLVEISEATGRKDDAAVARSDRKLVDAFHRGAGVHLDMNALPLRMKAADGAPR